MKKIEKFVEKSELPKSILAMKIDALIFSSSFRGGNEKFADIRAGSLSHLATKSQDSTIKVTPLALVFKSEPARRLCYHWPRSLKMFIK